jgi:hypothetical protein
MDIVSRKEAKEKGLKRYFTGNVCKQGHLAERYTLTGHCCECVKEEARKRQATWRSLNREKHREQISKYQKENREKVTEYQKLWKHNNPEKVKISSKKSRQTNKHVRNAHTAKRRARKAQRTPLWLTNDELFLIQEAYALASLRTKLTGIEWHVDHIIPMQGDTVSGLHCINNLQIILAKENCSKSNRWDWDQQK